MRRVLRRPGLFAELAAGLPVADPIVRLRAADAMEKITALRPALLRPHRGALLRLAAREAQQEVRWHLAQMIPRLALSPRQRRAAEALLRRWLADPSRIVQVATLQALADLSRGDPGREARMARLIRRRMRTGGPAVRARGRRLLRELGGGPRPRASVAANQAGRGAAGARRRPWHGLGRPRA